MVHVRNDWPLRSVRGKCRTLAVVFGDQLDHDSALLRELDPSSDVILMMEVCEESRHVPSHVQRTVLFLSAMRHYALALVRRGFRIRYVSLEDDSNTQSFSGEIRRAIEALQPSGLACVHPGEWRVRRIMEHSAQATRLPLSILPDDHFVCSPEVFAEWAAGRASLTMEYFYREQRRRTGYLMEDDEPIGGAWNFDKDNRESFGKAGPGRVPKPVRFPADAITLDVFESVRKRLPDLYGQLDSPADFGWPVSRTDALECLADFCTTRLPLFGRFEDAMWTGHEHLYHSLLSPALNLKLISPRECCQAALAEHAAGRAPLASVEAFIRQIIGWREFIRGIYWLEGPEYAARNALSHTGQLPAFYWTADTDMNCMRECLGQVVRTGYGHHIQRLMVTGNFALIAGIHPKTISDWYLGMYVDGVDWVTLPNTLGMVMHADHRAGLARGETGLVGTKPYAASANYIGRMSNYCDGCAYDPGIRVDRDGRRACPFNTFYWDFLIRNRDTLRPNRRMTMMLANVDKLKPQERVQIQVSAQSLRSRFGIAAQQDGPSSPSHARPHDSLFGASSTSEASNHTTTTPRPQP